jgi:hypothetical protein
MGLRGKPYRENREDSPQSDAMSDFIDVYLETHPRRDDWAVFGRREFGVNSVRNHIAITERFFALLNADIDRKMYP